MPDDVLSEIKVSLGKIEVNVDNVLHRVRNIEQGNLTFVPRREIEKTTEILEERIDKLEERHEWFYRWLMGAWAAGGAVVAAGSKKLGVW